MRQGIRILDMVVSLTVIPTIARLRSILTSDSSCISLPVQVPVHPGWPVLYLIHQVCPEGLKPANFIISLSESIIDWIFQLLLRYLPDIKVPISFKILVCKTHVGNRCIYPPILTILSKLWTPGFPVYIIVIWIWS
jgi:hypothetical protein